MKEITPDYFVYVGLGLVVLELFLGVNTGFDLLLSGIVLIVGGGIFWLTRILWLSVGLVLVLISLYFMFLRRSLRDRLLVITHKTNIDKLKGAKGVVVKKIEIDKAGQVKVDNEIWRAMSEEKIEEGERITVEGIEGVSLKVKKQGGK